MNTDETSIMSLRGAARKRRVKPISLLTTALPQLLPSRDETLFLRACVDTGERGQLSWQEWRGQHILAHELEQEGSPYKRLLPLLAFTLAQYTIPDSPDAPFLRAARFREELRGQKYRAILASALEVLNGQVDALLLNGAALAQLVYPDPNLRHSHDIDLLVQEHELDRTATLLARCGFQENNSRVNASSRFLTHTSGLPIVLHTTLFRASAQAPFDELKSNAVSIPIENQIAHTLAPAEALVQLLAQAFYARQKGSLLWACDVYFLITRTPSLDWSRVYEFGVGMRCALPLSLLLAYLHSELDAPIPPDMLLQLRNAVTNLTRAEQEAALNVLRRNGYGRFRVLWQCADWQERTLLAHWAFTKVKKKYL